MQPRALARALGRRQCDWLALRGFQDARLRRAAWCASPRGAGATRGSAQLASCPALSLCSVFVTADSATWLRSHQRGRCNIIHADREPGRDAECATSTGWRASALPATVARCGYRLFLSTESLSLCLSLCLSVFVSASLSIDTTAEMLAAPSVKPEHAGNTKCS
eukprot:1348131-Rhodomonas_salina.5